MVRYFTRTEDELVLRIGGILEKAAMEPIKEWITINVTAQN